MGFGFGLKSMLCGIRAWEMNKDLLYPSRLCTFNSTKSNDALKLCDKLKVDDY